MKNNCDEWFKKAEDDKLSIQAILKENGPTNTICFLAQQMTEKYLKSLLIFYQQVPPKIHDLIRLQELIKKINPDITDFNEQIDTLNHYYIETRYPGDYPEFDEDDAKEAFASALEIEEFVLKIIKLKR